MKYSVYGVPIIWQVLFQVVWVSEAVQRAGHLLDCALGVSTCGREVVAGADVDRDRSWTAAPDKGLS